MTPHERNVVRAGVVIVAAGWTVLRGLPAAIEAERATRERIEAKAELLATGRADVASLDSLERAAHLVKGRVAAIAPLLLSGGSASEAASDFSAQVRAVLESQGARVNALQPMDDSATAGDLRRIRLRVELTTDLEGLFATLRALDLYPVIIRISLVRVVANDGADGGAYESLSVELGLAALYLQNRRE